jgi:hypothetical protein
VANKTCTGESVLEWFISWRLPRSCAAENISFVRHMSPPVEQM